MIKYEALRKTLAIVLAGGQGSRLFPLTVHRAKPAVPFAGNYRIIDFALSNCLNSGLRKIAVLTQYRSYSLDHHIQKAWNIFNYELDEFVKVIPPQHCSVENWYEGTADAIFKNINLIEEWNPEYILVLSGDHLYKMNYFEMLKFHIEKGSDLTVSSIEYPQKSASEFGILEIDEDNRIIGFEEKPANPKSIPGKPESSLTNMGIYIFSLKPMIKALIEDAKKDTAHDFGKNIIPNMIEKNYNIFAYNFFDEKRNEPKYWRDIGTIDAYYDANLEILKRDPVFDLYEKSWPLRTLQEQMPPAKIVHSDEGMLTNIVDSIICGGSIFEGSTIINSVISPNVIIHKNSYVENSIVFDGVNIGKNVKIKNCIIDKNVNIPDNKILGYYPEEDSKRFVISDKGRTIIPSNIIF